MKEMDAGLAAVLGAIVGAIGSSGAAITTSILGRGQARMQMRAEHVRMLREPRRNSYIAFAECSQQVVELCGTARQCATTASVEEGPQRADRLREAVDAYKQASDLFYGELQKALASVTVEGPEHVTEAALRAVDALLTDRGTLHRWIRFLENNTATEEHENESSETYVIAHRERLNFLNKASRVLAEDGFSREPLKTQRKGWWRRRRVPTTATHSAPLPSPGTHGPSSNL